MNGEIDKLIIKALKEEKELTTYQLAKKVGVSWATIITHCLKLQATGVVDSEAKVSLSGKKILWRIKSKGG